MSYTEALDKQIYAFSKFGIMMDDVDRQSCARPDNNSSLETEAFARDFMRIGSSGLETEALARDFMRMDIAQTYHHRK